MALTQIRKEQIKDLTIDNSKIADNAAIAYTKLDLAGSIVAGDLNSNGTVEQQVLESKLIGLWNYVGGVSTGGASSVVVTTEVLAASATDAATNDGSAKGVLTTGTGANGAGSQNYRVQIRAGETDTAGSNDAFQAGDSISDGIGGSVYGELTESGGAWTLSFYKSDDTAFTFADTAEESSVSALAGSTFVTGSTGKYFTIHDGGDNQFDVWLNTGGEAAPSAGGTTIEVTMNSTDTPAEVATAIASAVNGNAAFGASSDGGIVTITNAVGGAATDIGAGTSGMTVQVLEQGIDGDMEVDFMFVEIYDYYSAPLKGFITGMGFADVAAVSGTHNHNDLYYTKAELEGGTLDDRYYTENEMDAGQLDNRYYTETELDGGQLDNRYFTESELSSTAGGSSGSSLIGYDDTTSSAGYSTVQGAVEGLDARLDSLEGAGGATHSMDDAYDDGSAVTVDSTDVDWSLGAGRDFRIFDGTDADKFVVANGTGASSVKIDTTGGVDIDTDAGFVVDDDGGAALHLYPAGNIALYGASGNSTVVSGNAGDASLRAEADGGVTLVAATNADPDAINIDATAGGVDIDAAGDISLVSSAGNVEFDDQYLAAAIDLSQTDVTALHAQFGHDVQTDFDWTRTDTAVDTPTSLVGAINANRSDIYEYVELLGTQGGAHGTAAGANLVGVDGITGILPTGGSVGSDSNLQAMLEGLANAAGSLKAYADQAAFTTAKSGGDYLPVDTLVLIKDTNRFARVMVDGTGIVEDTDFEYLWSDANPMGGASFEVDVTGDALFNADTSFALTSPDINLNSGGPGGELALVGNDATINAPGTITLDGTTEVQIDSALVDINGTDVTVDGIVAITGTTNENVTVTTSGTGEVQLASAQEIDLTGGDIDINAGAGKSVFIDSDTEVQINGGATLDLDAAAMTLDTTDGYALIDDSGVGVQAYSVGTVAMGTTDQDAGLAVSSAAVALTMGATGANTSQISMAGGLGIQLETDDDNIILNSGSGAARVYNSATGASGGYEVTAAGALDMDSAAGQIITIDSDTEVAISGAAVNVDGALTATGDTDDHMTVTSSGTGEVRLVSAKEVDIDAPLTQFHGDVVIPEAKWLDVGNISITSVDPTDHATISGSRTGTANVLNKLVNAGFESGSGSDADDWTEDPNAARADVDKYYGSYSMHYATDNLGSNVNVVRQSVSGLTASTAHTVKFYIKGSTGGDIDVQLPGGTAVAAVNGAQTYTDWTLVSVNTPADNDASGNFDIIATGTGSEDYDFYIDAVAVFEGASSAENYLTDQMSELVFTIGDEDNDRIVFRSAGTATEDLVRINQDTVEILGDLHVTGTTTSVDSTTIDIGDERISLLANQASGLADAFYEVKRGSDNDVAIKWNETTDKWELTNDGTTYETIVTAGTGGSLSMDGAYDGGSTVSVDDGDVLWNLDAGSDFIISDTANGDSNKFRVRSTNGLDSIQIDTSGGVDIDTDTGFTVNDDSGSSFALNSAGGITASAPAGQFVSLQGPVATAVLDDSGFEVSGSAAGTISLYNDYGDVTVTAQASGGGAAFTVDADNFSVDSTEASNVTVTGADLTLSTATSGDVNVSAAGTVDIDGGTSVTVDATNIVLTGATQVVGAMDFDGAVDMDGATASFTLTDTGAQSFLVDTLGGINLVSDAGIDLSDDSGNQVQLNVDGSLDLHAAAGQIASLATVSGGNVSTDAGGVDLTGTDILATGAFEVVGASTLDAVTIDGNLGQSGGTVTLNSNGAMDLDASGAFTLDALGVAVASNAADITMAATDANIELSTLVSGEGDRDISLLSSGALLLDDQFTTSSIPFSETGVTGLAAGFTATSIVGAINEAYSAAAGANTLDEVYDGETGTRLITMDNGSIEWLLYDTYDFTVRTGASGDIFSVAASAGGDVINAGDATNDVTMNVYGTFSHNGDDATFTLDGTGADSFKVNTDGGIDLDADAGVTIDDASGSAMSIASSGDVVLGSAGSGTGATSLTAGTGGMTVTSLGGTAIYSNGTGDIDIDSANAVDIDAVTAVEIDGASFSVDGTSASNVSVTGGDLTVSTITSGNLVLASAGNVDMDGTAVAIDATAAFDIAGGAASSVSTTDADLTVGPTTASTSGELNFSDNRLAAVIPLSDASNTSLPGSATSILGALTEAYENSIDITYEEVTATSADVTNDYVIVTSSLLPDSGVTFPASPATMRGDGEHIAVYLNGLRLSDTEWRYNYDGGSSERRITFDGTSNITLVAGDLVVVEVRKIQ